MNEGVVEGGEDAGNTENELAWMRLSEHWSYPRIFEFLVQLTITGEGAEGDVLLGGGSLLLGGHCDCCWMELAWMEYRKKKMKKSTKKKVDVCPRLQVNADWLIWLEWISEPMTNRLPA